MINFLCEAATGGDAATRGVMTALLIVVLIGMLVMPYFSQKKKNKEYEAMLGSLKSGDLVKTAGGIIGRINKIIDKGDIKTVIIETGSKTEKSYIEFDLSMIYCVLKSTKVENETEETDETETEESVDETEEATLVEEIKETSNVEVSETPETEEVQEETEEVEESEEPKEEPKKQNTPKIKVTTSKKSGSKKSGKKTSSKK